MANRYWVAATEANWTDTANWSATSGGSGGASVPGSSDNVYFDGNGLGNCITVNSHTILALNMDSAYTGVLYQTNTAKTFSRGLTITANSVVGSGCIMAGGSANPSLMTINSCRLTFNGGSFVNGNVNAILGTSGELVANTTWGGTVSSARGCGIAGTIAGDISLISSFNGYTVSIIGDLTAEGSFSVGSSGQTSNALSNTGNHNLTFKGDMAIPDVTYTAGTGTITLDNTAAQSINFNGQAVEPVIVSDASTGAIALGADFTTPYVHDCSGLIDLNGFAITETGTDPNPCGAGVFRLLIDGFNDLLINGGLVD